MTVKKKATKKPSAKQLAARKKFAAAAKARSKTKKKAGPKKRTTSASGKRTRTTAAKKARKAKNTVEGYYPNPVEKYVIKVNLTTKSAFISNKTRPYKISPNLNEAAEFSKESARKTGLDVHALLEMSGKSQYKSVEIVKK